MHTSLNIAIANEGQGVGIYIPKRIVTNFELAEMFEANNVRTKSGQILTAEWMEEHVGLRKRHWAAEDEFSSHLGVKACVKAIAEAGVDLRDLDLIRVGSSSPDCVYPGLSCLIQNGLVKHNEPKLSLDAVDVSGACTSGLHALIAAKQSILDNHDYRFGLAVGAETMSKVIDFNDPNSQLWGDGAGAVVLEKTQEDRGIVCSIFGSTPEACGSAESVGLGVKFINQNIVSNAFLIGSEVQRFVLKTLEDIIPQTIRKANRILGMQGKNSIALNDVKMFALHQANGTIFNFPSRKLGIPLDKFYVNFGEYGNTSSASVLICLTEMIQKRFVKCGDLVMLVAFGAGLTWGSVLLRI